MTRPKIGTMYKHYQGKTYYVMGFCRDYGTNHEKVVFQCTDGNIENQVWNYPVNQFFKQVSGQKQFTEIKIRKE